MKYMFIHSARKRDPNDALRGMLDSMDLSKYLITTEKLPQQPRNLSKIPGVIIQSYLLSRTKGLDNTSEEEECQS